MTTIISIWQSESWDRYWHYRAGWFEGIAPTKAKAIREAVDLVRDALDRGQLERLLRGPVLRKRRMPTSYPVGR